MGAAADDDEDEVEAELELEELPDDWMLMLIDILLTYSCQNLRHEASIDEASEPSVKKDVGIVKYERARRADGLTEAGDADRLTDLDEADFRGR